MSAAAAAETPAPAKGKKKLILILAVVGVLVLGGGGAAVFMMKKKAAAEAAEAAEDGGEAQKPAKAAAKGDPKAVPVFVPLDPFTVNLADRDAERYAQIAVTLEVDDLKTGDQMKIFMPAIRNNILLAMADRTAAEMMGREGKDKLAETIKRETSKALGVEVEEEDHEADAEDSKPAKGDAKPKKKKKKAAPVLPVKAVHFSSFIIQ